jgi:hypothetical protein
MESIVLVVTHLLAILGGGYGGHKLGRRAEAKAREIVAQGQAIGQSIAKKV